MKTVIRIAVLTLAVVMIAGLLFGCAASKFKGNYYCDGRFYYFDGKGNGTIFYMLGDEKVYLAKFVYDVSGDNLILRTVDSEGSWYDEGRAYTCPFKFIDKGFVLTENGEEGLFMKVNPRNFDVDKYEDWCEDYYYGKDVAEMFSWR